jgi:hypothetical protein
LKLLGHTVVTSGKGTLPGVLLAEDAGKCGVLATTMIRLGADAMLDF